MKLIILFALFSTRRISEICRLRWDDLDRERNRVIIRKVKDPRKSDVTIYCTLHPRAMAIIDLMPKVDERIFPFDARNISARLRIALKRLGLFSEESDLCFHLLRHEGISHYFELGENISRVMMVSGHRSLSSLERYKHLYDYGVTDKFADFSVLRDLGLDHLPALLPRAA